MVGAVAPSPRTFLERWLVAHGMPSDRAGPAAAAARARAARFPAPVGQAYRAIEGLIDRFGPAVLLGRLQSAHSLDSDGFDALEARLQHNPQVAVRLAYILARMPAFDHLYPDPPPAPSGAHPLEALLPANRARTRHGRDFDVVVIGSGAGGAPVAWSLARRGLRVAVVENGDLVRPADYGRALERHYLDQGLVGSVAGGGTALVLAGRAVGGTTVVNSGTSLRPLPERLAAWDAGLGTDFAGGALDPWLDAASGQAGVTEMRRELLDASADVIERGLRALGREGTYVLPRNAPDCEGAGRCCFGCPKGAKMSTDRSFLPGALEAGAVLFHRTEALDLREGADRVEVLVRGPDGERRVLRARQLVVAAGALESPLLLRAARLGDRWRQAGDGLRIHPASKAFALMPTPLEGHGIPQGLGYRDPDLPRVVFEGVHTPAGAAAPMVSSAGRRHRWWLERYDRLATYGAMVWDRTSGSVRRVGGQRLVRYGLDPADARDLGAAVLVMAEAFFAAGAERVLLPVTGVGIPTELAGPDDLRRIRPEDFTPARIVTAGFHPQGTCAMGRVVDPELRLIGSRRVSVCDASVLPGSPGVNPQVTIMALALRCADRLAGELGR